MAAITEDTELIRHALAYVNALFEELTTENGAPPPGTQNQAVDLILADPELARAVAGWGREADSGEATTRPPQRLPQDATWRRVRGFLEGAIGPTPPYAPPEPARKR